MIPDEDGYYWIKTLYYDGTGGKSISDWYIAWYGKNDGWVTIGSECGLDGGSIVEMGFRIEEPS